MYRKNHQFEEATQIILVKDKILRNLIFPNGLWEWRELFKKKYREIHIKNAFHLLK